MLYAMMAKDRPGTAEQRAAVRGVHLEHLEGLGQQLKLAGALLDAQGTPAGSLIVIEAETLEAATAIFHADPFVSEGIFDSVEVKAWRIAFDHLSPKV
jgi:uncharacterized protein YciI